MKIQTNVAGENSTVEGSLPHVWEHDGIVTLQVELPTKAGDYRSINLEMSYVEARAVANVLLRKAKG